MTLMKMRTMRRQQGQSEQLEDHVKPTTRPLLKPLKVSAVLHARCQYDAFIISFSEVTLCLCSTESADAVKPQIE